MENARRELEEALFSREELHELPINLNTQFFKVTDEKARVTVLAHVDLKGLRFRKAEGRNYNDLTVVGACSTATAITYRAIQKKLEMRLKDEHSRTAGQSGSRFAPAST